MVIGCRLGDDWCVLWIGLVGLNWKFSVCNVGCYDVLCLLSGLCEPNSWLKSVCFVCLLGCELGVRLDLRLID